MENSRKHYGKFQKALWKIPETAMENSKSSMENSNSIFLENFFKENTYRCTIMEVIAMQTNKNIKGRAIFSD